MVIQSPGLGTAWAFCCADENRRSLAAVRGNRFGRVRLVNAVPPRVGAQRHRGSHSAQPDRDFPTGASQADSHEAAPTSGSQ